MNPTVYGTTRRSPMLLTCAIASVLVALAVAASAASAATPEYWKVKSPIKSKISYTWSTGQLRWVRPSASETWECLSSSGEGELTNATEGTLTLTLKNCKWKDSLNEVVSCTSATQEAGTIVTEPLKTHLYYGIDVKGTRRAVNDLSPAEGTHIASFTCGGFWSFEWRGSLIGGFEHTNEERSTNSLVVRRGSIPGEQEYKKYETLTAPTECSKIASTSDYLEEHLSSWSEIAFETEVPVTITFKESVEIHKPC